MTGVAPHPIRLLIIDDSPLIRAGLRAVLEDNREVAIVGEAGTAADGLAAVLAHQPDVVLLDLRLPDLPGLQACREILRRRPGTHVLILTSSADERNVHEAIAVGASGYLLKESDGTALGAAVKRAASGHSVIDPSLADQVLNLMRRPPAPGAAERLAVLSAQERRILVLLADGLTNRQIGDQLHLTEKTVKNYLATIFDKLHVTRRAQAAALYAQEKKASAN